MLLKEFFGKPLEISDSRDIRSKQDTQSDRVLSFILEHDRLYKDYLIPLLDKVKKSNQKGKLDQIDHVAEFLPLVNKGCKEYYAHHNLKEKLGKLFPRQFREDLCKKLFDYCCENNK